MALKGVSGFWSCRAEIQAALSPPSTSTTAQAARLRLAADHVVVSEINIDICEHRGALRGTPGSSYPQPEPNATELPKWRPRPPKVDRAASLRAFAHADTRRTPLRAADRAPPRPRPPPRAEENCTLHLLVWERNTSRGTLGVLPTWAPATAMLPLRIVRHLLVYPYLWYPVTRKPAGFVPEPDLALACGRASSSRPCRCCCVWD